MWKLVSFADVLNVVDHVIFHLCVANILRASGGSKKDSSFEMQMALTTLPSATTLASGKLFFLKGENAYRPRTEFSHACTIVLGKLF
jgi:hypothetical protein